MSDGRKIIDLDVLVPEDLHVKVGGQTYKFPGDAPTEQILRVSALIERQEKAAISLRDGETEMSVDEMLEMREEISNEIEALFRIRNPELEEGAITLSDSQTLSLVDQLFAFYYSPGGDAEEAEDGDEGGGRPTESQASSPPKPRSSGRSRPRSSAKGRRASASSKS